MTKRTVRLAEEKDGEKLFQYLEKEPEFNTFIIGNIHFYGINNDFHQIYIQEAGVMMEACGERYRESFLAYSQKRGVDYTEMAGIFEDYLKKGVCRYLNGKKEIIDEFIEYLGELPKHIIKEQNFAVCYELNPSFELTSSNLVELTQPEESPEVIGLLQRLPEFGGYREGAEKLMADNIANGFIQVTHIRDPKESKIVSTATATCETDKNAMIIGVGTDPDPAHRKKGYASACSAALVQDLNKRGKSATLFYDNPKAGSIYKKLGFKELGMWKTIEFDRRMNEITPPKN